MNNKELPRSGHTQQVTTTLFAENHYSFANNKILTAGASCSFLRNNSSQQDDDLFGYRIGYTYTNTNLVSKTTVSHIESSLDPYMVNSFYLHESNKKTPIEKQDVYMQNLKYNYQSNKYELIVDYMVLKNKLLPMPEYNGLLDSYDKDLKIMGGILRYTRDYRAYDKLEITLGTNHIKNLPFLDKITQYSAILRNFNTVGSFDIFNEILYSRDSNEKKDYYDYSAGVIYHSTDDLSFSIKGSNLFNTAAKTSYIRLNPVTLQQDKPLKISPIDKKVMLRMEYTF